MIMVLAVAGAGGCGAVLRYLLDLLISRRVHRFPLATLVINISGAALLGLLVGLVGLVGGRWLPTAGREILGTGFLGGFTTFSTASVQTVRLLQERRWTAGASYAVGTLVGSVLAALAGLALGSRLAG